MHYRCLSNIISINYELKLARYNCYKSITLFNNKD